MERKYDENLTFWINLLNFFYIAIIIEPFLATFRADFCHVMLYGIQICIGNLKKKML